MSSHCKTCVPPKREVPEGGGYSICPLCNRLRDHDGNCRQRYEVHCTRNGMDMLVGWSADASGGYFAHLVDVNPSWKDLRVVDLHLQHPAPA